MQTTFYYMRNASLANKTIVIHADPGPVFVPFTEPTGMAYNTSAGTWAGDVSRPDDIEGVKVASRDQFVMALAPFLIVASEYTFFSYAWFYDLETGYTPCEGDDRLFCMSPDGWYPEYSKHLGPPLGDAVQDGWVWTREFEGAKVYVDVSDRTKSQITWYD